MGIFSISAKKRLFLCCIALIGVPFGLVFLFIVIGNVAPALAIALLIFTIVCMGLIDPTFRHYVPLIKVEDLSENNQILPRSKTSQLWKFCQILVIFLGWTALRVGFEYYDVRPMVLASRFENLFLSLIGIFGFCLGAILSLWVTNTRLNSVVSKKDDGLKSEKLSIPPIADPRGIPLIKDHGNEP